MLRRALLLFICLLAPATPAWAAGNPSVMIIFDGSGSMWGKIKGESQTRLSQGRKALRKALEGTRLSVKPNVGLMSFGHRRGRDCSDTGVLIDVKPLDVKGIVESLDNLNPRGRGPFTRALREAADLLPGTDKNTPSSIILFHDSLDNCRQNPCDFARDIAKSKPQLRVYVISLGLDSDDFRAMRCLSKLTNGRHFNVQSGADLDAAAATAWRLATTSAAGATALSRRNGGKRMAGLNAGMAGQGSAAGVAVPSIAGTGLILRAALSADGTPLNDAIEWRVLARGRSDDRPLYQATTPVLAAKLPPGRYTVEAKLGQAKASKIVTIKKGKTAEGLLNFNAGRITIPSGGVAGNGSGANGIDVFTASTLSVLRRIAGRRKPQYTPVLTARNTGAPLVLPAGKYLVINHRGALQARSEIDLKPGARLSPRLLATAGQLRVTAETKTRGVALDDVTITIWETAPNEPGGKREVARAIGARTDFTLPAGTYSYEAKKDLARVSGSVAIKPGSIETINLTIPAATLRLEASFGDTALGTSQPVQFKLRRIEGGPDDSYWTADPTPELTLAPGRYRVESRVGVSNAVLAYRITMRPKQNGLLKMVHKAGRLRVKLTSSAGGPALPQVLWSIFDANNQLVRQTSKKEPEIALAKGRYLVRATRQGQRFESRVDVATGDNKQVELLLK